MRLGLERMHAVLGELGDPHRGIPTLHVVGTNGKSSTTRLAAAALGTAARPVGAYLSPHIEDWRERIRIDGEALDEEAFARSAGAVRAAGERVARASGEPVTQFEALTAMAFAAFAEHGVGAMAIEAGLGGRYDASNVLAPAAAVALTNVDLDHTAYLGDTVAAIAGEKLAVCADGARRLVVGRLSPEAAAAVAAECARRDLHPLRHGEGLDARAEGEGVTVMTPHARYRGLPLALRGDFQRDNLAVAVAGAEMVTGGALDRDALAAAIGAVRVPGRLEVVPGSPPVVLDGAHNPAGVRALSDALPAVAAGRRPVVAVTSVLADKDAGAMLAGLAGGVDRIVATRSTHPRALDPEGLAALARAAGRPAEVVVEPLAALAAARAHAGPQGLVVVAGSLYLLADLRPAVVAGAAEPPATLAPAREGSDSPEAK